MMGEMEYGSRGSWDSMLKGAGKAERQARKWVSKVARVVREIVGLLIVFRSWEMLRTTWIVGSNR
jgi:hypothetical protein